jgi:hypothetical protein
MKRKVEAMCMRVEEEESGSIVDTVGGKGKRSQWMRKELEEINGVSVDESGVRGKGIVDEGRG